MVLILLTPTAATGSATLYIHTHTQGEEATKQVHTTSKLTRDYEHTNTQRRHQYTCIWNFKAQQSYLRYTYKHTCLSKLAARGTQASWQVQGPKA